MSSAPIAPSYTPADGAATRTQPAAELQARVQERVQDRLALVIPTLREADNIGGLLVHIRSVLDPLGMAYEILVVDDDSRDGTEEIVSAIAQKDPHVRLLIRKGERGLSGAVLYGWRQTNAAILGVMDADLQHPPELLPKSDCRYFCRQRPGDWQPLHCGRPGGASGIPSANGSPLLADVGHLANSASRHSRS
jgi:glycosyltransferase involved in cell wall biosynthesis